MPSLSSGSSKCWGSPDLPMAEFRDCRLDSSYKFPSDVSRNLLQPTFNKGSTSPLVYHPAEVVKGLGCGGRKVKWWKFGFPRVECPGEIGVSHGNPPYTLSTVQRRMLWAPILCLLCQSHGTLFWAHLTPSLLIVLIVLIPSPRNHPSSSRGQNLWCLGSHTPLITFARWVCIPKAKLCSACAWLK